MPRIRLLTALALLLAVAPAGANTLESQREAFRRALPQAEAGRWGQVEPLLEVLADYPLAPDLRAAWLRTQMSQASDAEIGAFLEQYPALGFSAALRRQWAGSLARRGAWAEYLALYDAHFADADNAVLECHALNARVQLGRTGGLEDAILRRWLMPVSQPDECDPAFAWLDRQGAITPERRRERMELALGAGQFNLARWLARPLGQEALDEVNRWERMHAGAGTRLVSPAGWHDTPRDRALMLYGFNRLAGEDLALAASRWPGFRASFAFSIEERAAVDRRIALLHAWRHLPEATAQLVALPPESHDHSTREWAVRVAIRAQDWRGIERALAGLDAEAAAQPVWNYWQGRVLEVNGRAEQAKPVFEALAAERGYYSFLSADRIGAEYNWQHARTQPDESVIAALDARHDVARARELFFTGLEGRGRVEWQALLPRLSPAERAQAGILAQRWGWYSRAITAATGGGVEDDLYLRFPLPWRPVFEEQSRRNGISSAWAFGVARSESLFMPDVSSGAGAIGLMQLLPGTGEQTARRAGIEFRGRQTLLDPASNVALGTRYLADMLARYNNHRVLATAAYNAGPGRVDRWLPTDGYIPAEAWVDSVPFNETRGYVQRVLSSEAVFAWRMSGETTRISDAMQPVTPRARGR